MNGGGIHAGPSSNLRNNTLTSNHATNEGGGIRMSNGTTATNNQLSNNSASKGGGLYVDGLMRGFCSPT